MGEIGSNEEGRDGWRGGGGGVQEGLELTVHHVKESVFFVVQF